MPLEPDASSIHNSANAQTGYLPADFDPANRVHVRSLVAHLLAEAPQTPDAAFRWYALFCEASDALSECQTQLEIQTFLDTQSKEAAQQLQQFEEDVLSTLLQNRAELMRLYLRNPWQRAMHGDDRGMLRNDFQIRLKKSEGDLSSLQIEENQIVRSYRAFFNGLTCSFLGRTVPLSVAVGKLNERSEDIRRAAFIAYWSTVKTNQEAIQRFFIDLLKNRIAQRKRSGSTTFEEFVYTDMGRTDYTPEDSRTFRNDVVKEIVPIIRSLSEIQARETTDKTAIKPWNARIWNSFFPEGQPASGSREDFLKSVSQVLADLNPACSGLFFRLNTEDGMDLFARRNKAPGAFCALRPVKGLPFIFGNFSVSLKDSITFFHEFGHAFHAYCSAPIKNTLLRNPGLEFCEFAATSFEFFAQRHIKHLWPHPEAAAQARGFHLFQSASFLPFAVQLDAWQSAVYAQAEHEESTGSDLNAIWSELTDIYRPHLSWDGLEDFKGLGWCSRQHVFTTPFYYID
jgi:oligoendopeptidase F